MTMISMEDLKESHILQLHAVKNRVACQMGNAAYF